MTLADDILAKIRQDFSGGEMLPVIEMLTDLQGEDARFLATGFCGVFFSSLVASSMRLLTR